MRNVSSASVVFVPMIRTVPQAAEGAKWIFNLAADMGGMGFIQAGLHTKLDPILSTCWAPRSGFATCNFILAVQPLSHHVQQHHGVNEHARSCTSVWVS